MDFALRCNSLKCRAILTERAIVTTCSHIFCVKCSETIGLTASPGGNRICPACQSVLPNPDDVVSTSLNPTDDYKTSVLSGLAPSSIMECAGRALAFWCYQSTQEIVYQEYLAKTLTDKYNHLNIQMDRIVNEANSELEILNQRLNNMQTENERIRNDNTNLVAAFREKSRKHQQTQELYDRLKRREMMATTQNAAAESVDDVLGTIASRASVRPVTESHPIQSTPQASDHRHVPPFDSGFNSGKHMNYTERHERQLSNRSNGSGGMMPPPPPLRQLGGHRVNAFEGANETPSSHRIRIGHPTHLPGPHPTVTRRSPNTANGILHDGTLHRPKSFRNINSVNEDRSTLSGYGMSAGMKIGRQQVSRFPPSMQASQSDQHERQFTLDEQVRQERTGYI